MYLEFYDNNGSRSVRVVYSVREPNKEGVPVGKKKLLQYLGAVKKFDDGKPDFEARMRQGFHDRTFQIPGFDYDEAEKKIGKAKEADENEIHLILYRDKYPTKMDYNIGYFFLDVFFEQLGIADILRRYKSDSKITYDLVNLIKLFVFDRVLRPASKQGTVNYRATHPFFNFDHVFSKKNNWYRALTVLNNLDSKIQVRMNTKMKNSNIGRKNDVMFYDVTNCYFEIPYPDEPVYLMDEEGNILNDEIGNPIEIESGFRVNYKSKEERHLPLVQIGILIDENAIPVAVHTFAGNTADPKTCESILDNEVDKLDVGRFVLVADNAMYSQNIFYKIVSGHNGYIVRKSILKSDAKTKEWVCEDKDWVTKYAETELNQSIAELVNDSDETEPENENDTKANTANHDEPGEKSRPEVTFKYKSRKINRNVQSQVNGQKVSVSYKVQQVVYWSYAHYQKDVYDGEKLRTELRQAKANPNLLKEKNRRLWQYLTVDIIDKKTGAFLKDTEIILSILESKLDERERFYGYFIVETTELQLHELIVLGKYRGLSRIENSFRICKSDLDIRPMFVSTPEHIKAHVLLCYIALTIVRIIQYYILKHQGHPTNACANWSLGMSEERLRNALNDYCVCAIQEPYYMMNSMSEDQELLNNVFNVPPCSVPTGPAIKRLKEAINRFKM